MPKKNKPQRAYVLIMTTKQALQGVAWTEDFEKMADGGWQEHFPKEARLIMALRAALGRPCRLLACRACGCRYAIVTPGDTHGDSSAAYMCPWCRRKEGERS